jgi:hypothetical protein
MQTQTERSEAFGWRFDSGPVVFDSYNKVSRNFRSPPIHSQIADARINFSREN